MSAADAAFLRRILMVLAAAAGALLLWRLRTVILLAFGAVLVSLLLRSLSEPLAKRFRLGSGAALAITAPAVVLAAAVLVAFFGWRVEAQIGEAARELPQGLAVVKAWVGALPMGPQIRAALDQARLGAVLPMLTRLPSYALAFTAAAADLLLALVGGLYLAAQPKIYRRGLLGLVRTESRARFGEFLDAAGETLRRWLLAQLLAMLTVGLLVGCGLWLIGAPAPAALGLFAALAESVPIVGPVISAVPALLLTVTHGFDKAGWTLLLFVIVHQFEGDLLLPLLQRRMTRLPPAVALFALAAFGLVFGLLGVMLATPAALLILLTVERLRPGDRAGEADRPPQ